MQFTSILAIYFLFFAATAFAMLPFGVRTDEEAGTPKIPGQADSAPHQFDLKRHLAKAALIAAILFAIYYLNWANGWVSPEVLDFYRPY